VNCRPQRAHGLKTRAGRRSDTCYISWKQRAYVHFFRAYTPPYARPNAAAIMQLSRARAVSVSAKKSTSKKAPAKVRSPVGPWDSQQQAAGSRGPSHGTSPPRPWPPCTRPPLVRGRNAEGRARQVGRHRVDAALRPAWNGYAHAGASRRARDSAPPATLQTAHRGLKQTPGLETNKLGARPGARLSPLACC
jgi:hypothetical protein